jgi:hypothetical protein
MVSEGCQREALGGQGVMTVALVLTGGHPW